MIETGLEVLESIDTMAERLGLQVMVGDYRAKIRPSQGKEAQVLDLEAESNVLEVSG